MVVFNFDFSSTFEEFLKRDTYFYLFSGSARCRSDNEDLEMKQELEPLDRGPYFDVSASKNVTALVGKTAQLNCRVRNLGDRTVSTNSSFQVSRKTRFKSNTSPLYLQIKYIFNTKT